MLLFGPRGGAVQELLHFVAAEKAHGIHTPRIYQKPYLSAETQRYWRHAEKTRSWPMVVDAEGEETRVDPSEERSPLSAEVIDKLQSLWRRNPALRDYTGAQRLSGDMPYQILEDVVDVLIQQDSSPLSQARKARYIHTVERANQQGIDPFYAAYEALPTAALQPCWNRARQWLYDYSLALWETQNQLWLAEGKRAPAGGVVYRPAKTTTPTEEGRARHDQQRTVLVVVRQDEARLIDPRAKKSLSRPSRTTAGTTGSSREYWDASVWSPPARSSPPWTERWPKRSPPRSGSSCAGSILPWRPTSLAAGKLRA